MNQLESWIYLEIGKLEFLVVFATFVHAAGFFELSSHPHILVSDFVFFHISATVIVSQENYSKRSIIAILSIDKPKHISN